MKLALVGNPNSGKTTLFNAITGSNQYVGNWPGVTVEKKEGKVLRNPKYGIDSDVTVVDLPGIYSLSPYTLEEVVSRDFILLEKLDAIINIVDASNIERNLYLTTQLLEMGIPVIIALNMMDIVEKRGDKIDSALLAKELGCEVVEITAIRGNTAFNAVSKAVEVAKQTTYVAPRAVFSDNIEKPIKEISDKIKDIPEVKGRERYYAIKIFERDSDTLEKMKFPDEIMSFAEELTLKTEDAEDDDSEGIITTERYVSIGNITNKALVKSDRTELTTSDKIDKLVTNRFLAIPIFIVIMGIVYSVAMVGPGLWLTDWVNEVLFGEIIPNGISTLFASWGVAPLLESLVLDGVVAGVGAVIGFLPQMLVLFLMLSILEDCGYMSRVAFIMDKVFRKFGLSGKSFIPLIISTGCGVPGVMATRTIENEKDRKMTIMLTNFMPCSAKLPIFALFAGALFGRSPLVAVSMYFIAVASVIVFGIILKKTKWFRGEPAPFVMELPEYRLPVAKGVIRNAFDQGKAFAVRAGTIIFASSIIIWTLSTFTFAFKVVEMENSMLASIGRFIAPIFRPLGFGDWKPAVATFTGLVAKENVVGTFGVLYGREIASEAGTEIWGYIAQDFSKLSGYSFMVFNLLCCPCFAAVGAIKREMNSKKWTAATIAFQCGAAYIVSFLIYNVGTLILSIF